MHANMVGHYSIDGVKWLEVVSSTDSLASTEFMKICKTIQNTKTHSIDNKVLDYFGAFIIEIHCTIRLNKVQHCGNCIYCGYALSLTSLFACWCLQEINFNRDWFLRD